MTELDKFQELKHKVLLKYQEHYPYFQGNWKNFSSQDIQNLMGLIEINCKQTISEKWIYTHLKAEINSKIPRKDMLHILCEFVGISGWDEFIFEEKVVTSHKSTKSKYLKKWILILFLIFILGFSIWYLKFNKDQKQVLKTIEIKNEFTNKKIKSDEVKVIQIQNSIIKPLEIKEGKIEIANKYDTKLVVKSPFYKTKTIDLDATNTTSKKINSIDLKPDDYAMMLKAFMVSDIKDWQTRKVQLNKILSDNLEVMVMLKDNLGVEYYNKNEFAQKLLIPSISIKKMKIIEIEKDISQKIKFIRIIQQ